MIRSVIRVGDFVKWVSAGIDQWTEPRRVVNLANEAGEWWAFVDGSMTGIPVRDLVRV